MNTPNEDPESSLKHVLESLARSGKTAGESGDEEPDEARIEELMHKGLRPDGARRIERLERQLDLPEEQDELDRVKIAEGFRADPHTRKKFIAQILLKVREEKTTPYGALRQLKKYEIAPDEVTFARFCSYRLLAYDEEGQLQVVYEFRDRRSGITAYEITDPVRLDEIERICGRLHG